MKDQLMLKVPSSVLALAGLFIASTLQAQYADSVVAYTAGSGVTPSYTDPTRSLGPPTTFIGYQNADPFNPPYLDTDLVSVGAGGSLTVQFSAPILNIPAHPYGLDFIIFGNSGFVITNGDFSGGGITDGSLFANNTGATRVWVFPQRCLGGFPPASQPGFEPGRLRRQGPRGNSLALFRLGRRDRVRHLLGAGWIRPERISAKHQFCSRGSAERQVGGGRFFSGAGTGHVGDVFDGGGIVAWVAAKDDTVKSIKLQAPSSREAPNTNFHKSRRGKSEFGASNFFGIWSLELSTPALGSQVRLPFRKTFRATLWRAAGRSLATRTYSIGTRPIKIWR